MTQQTQLTAEEVILSRHSVRQFKRDVVIPEEVLTELLTLAHSAPSAWNLQHWRFVVVTEQANKDRLLPLAYGQQQVSDASVVVLVLGDVQANLVAETVFADAPEAVRTNMVSQINSAYQNPQVGISSALSNASLAAMQLMLAAKAKGYDTCSMGGFDHAAVVKELNVPERYVPVMMITIGEAAQPGRATGRLPLSDIVIRESF
ncbi:NAD(P)H nitroreductase [Paenibacillus swuensis]|uniref:NAD(P)H nitroreductase n=1 Tax=Paenibacillus swuensis TaxID=1178515 RepID=A0A172TJ37_9BACL|nr:nitroreductase family protein [Paenibacillus swuensis]ANE46976.1 NAD(P)H nitroreductase [Paenibacillus swuensis]